ncbi:glycosyltransferase [Flavobacteriaceae bacterium Ap0902]|nr:glycosyltransferase [Flavobacteriaceae bacterium Ap0902]
MSKKPKLIRITTVPLSLDKLLEGQLKYMSQYFEVTAISASDKGYLEKIARRENVNYFPLELTRSITPFKDLSSLIKLIKYFRKVKPTIVHTHTPKAGTTGMIAAWITGVPIRLHTVAGLPLLETKGFRKLLLKTVEKITYACATNVLPNSNGLKDIILKEKFTKEKKLYIIGTGSSNGIDTSYFDPALYDQEYKIELRSKLGISEDDFVFIYVGRIVKDKGIEELVTAFKGLNHRCKLLLIGSKENKLDPLNKEVLKEINQNKNIIDLGWQKDVRPYLSISEVLTFPSYREGFPNVVLQAGAMQLPSIVSDINGNNEIIENKINGLIIPVKDVGSLENAMLLIQEDIELYRFLKKNTRTFIAQNFERDSIIKALKNFYENQLIAKKVNS